MKAISVTQLNSYIKNIFDNEELLHNISVVGEVFGVSLSRGVIYFQIKDESATLPCVCFYPNFISMLKDGQKVVLTGSPNYYVKGGRLNFNVIRVEEAGLGKLYEEFLRLKKSLEEEGLFDEAHKKPIPKDPLRVGLVTSKEGAVLQDIKNVAWRRNSALDLVLYNVKVQGRGAEDEIARGIDFFSNYDGVDAVIVARGGGSLEDLWAFNTEVVARAAYNCQKPLISAVGHETDFTVIDFVADLRAPTPSAAAELITSNKATRRQNLRLLVSKFVSVASGALFDKIAKVEEQTENLQDEFEGKVTRQSQSLASLSKRLAGAGEKTLLTLCHRCEILSASHQKLDPTAVLRRGYAIIEQEGKLVKNAASVALDKVASINFADGKVEAVPKKIILKEGE